MPFHTPIANPSGANYRATFADLCQQFPKPYPDEDPEAHAERQHRAMDAVVALVPYDAFEALLAVRIVAAGAHAADALHSAALAEGDDDKERQCRAQAASMMRQSSSALRDLQRTQARREKLEAAMHPATMEKAGYWFKSVSVPAPDSPRAGGDPGPPEPSAAPEEPPPPSDDAEPQRTQAQIDRDAKLYAVMYPDRVARIRAAGGLPPRLDFGPPEPEIVAALLRRPAERAQSHGTR